MNYFPITPPFLLLFTILFVIVAWLVVGKVLRFASVCMGVGPRVMSVVLAASLLFSYINIPIAYLAPFPLGAPAIVTYFGVEYVIPLTQDLPGTILAINMGGAVIPIGLSCYLTVRNRLYKLALLDVCIVAAVCYVVAEPVPGIGITLPFFIPPLVSAIVSLGLSRVSAAPLAYIGGCLGTLIGADLLNLGAIQGLGAPVASIGGAGTFDGIFVTGLVAVILAGLVTRKVEPARVGVRYVR